MGRLYCFGTGWRCNLMAALKSYIWKKLVIYIAIIKNAVFSHLIPNFYCYALPKNDLHGHWPLPFVVCV